MLEIKTNLDVHGKMLIPVQIRKALNLKDGDPLLVRIVDNELRVSSLKTIMKQAQEDFKKRSQSKKPALDEFLEMKREEQRTEEQKFGNKHE
jgi:AbrB family looped-hinge helix DNA binding protein